MMPKLISIDYIPLRHKPILFQQAIKDHSQRPGLLLADTYDIYDVLATSQALGYAIDDRHVIDTIPLIRM